MVKGPTFPLSFVWLSQQVPTYAPQRGFSVAQEPYLFLIYWHYERAAERTDFLANSHLKQTV